MKYSKFMQASRASFESRGTGLTIIEDSFCILRETDDPGEELCTWISKVRDNHSGEVFTVLVRDGNPGVGRNVIWMALSDDVLENLKRHLNK